MFPLLKIIQRNKESAEMLHLTTMVLNYKTYRGNTGKKLHTHKFNSCDEMNEFFEIQKLPKLTQDEIDNLNSL